MGGYGGVGGLCGVCGYGGVGGLSGLDDLSGLGVFCFFDGSPYTLLPGQAIYVISYTIYSLYLLIDYKSFSLKSFQKKFKIL